MIKILLFVSVGILAAIGLGYVLAAFQRWATRPRKLGRIVVVVPVCGEQKDAEALLRGTLNSVLPYVSGDHPTMLVADYGVAPQARRVCETFCQECPAAAFCSAKDLERTIRGKTGLDSAL